MYLLPESSNLPKTFFKGHIFNIIAPNRISDNAFIFVTVIILIELLVK